jgi:hypothetical protein
MVAAIGTAAVACSKSPVDGTPNPTGVTVEARGADAGAPGPSSAPSDNTKATAAPAAVAWHGSYESTPGSLFIAPELKGVKWVVPPSDAGLGAGAITITVDPKTGRVTGSVEGPLGPATVDGFADGATLSGTVSRKDPTDRGFTGTLDATEGDGGVSGTLHVALAEVSAVRTASFHLTQAAPTLAGRGAQAH